MGLDDASYGTVRSNILASDPLSSLNRIYAMLVQEERVRMMAKSTEERGLVVGLAMQANYKEKRRGDMVEKLMTCSHCGKNGHDMKGCFQLIGYPYGQKGWKLFDLMYIFSKINLHILKPKRWTLHHHCKTQLLPTL